MLIFHALFLGQLSRSLSALVNPVSNMENPDMERFAFEGPSEPLPTMASVETRPKFLLSTIQRAEDFESPIVLEFNRTRPNRGYSLLAYCPNDNNETISISTSHVRRDKKKTIYKKQNLPQTVETALRYERGYLASTSPHHNPPYFIADVDQRGSTQTLPEKLLYSRNVHRLFSKASTVTIWLGDHSPCKATNVSRAFTLASDLCSKIDRHGLESEHVELFMSSWNKTDFFPRVRDWQTLMKLLQRPYFRRVWAIPELAHVGGLLSNDSIEGPTVRCGLYTIPLKSLIKLLRASHRLRKLEEIQRTAFGSVLKVLHADGGLTEKKTSTDPLDFQGLKVPMIAHAAAYSAPGDAFDLFYALSSFLPGWKNGRENGRNGQSLRVQYLTDGLSSFSTKPIEDVYKSFMGNILSERRAHEVPVVLLLSIFFSVREAERTEKAHGVAKPIENSVSPIPEYHAPASTPPAQTQQFPSDPPLKATVQAIRVASVLAIFPQSTNPATGPRDPMHRLLDRLDPVAHFHLSDDFGPPKSLRFEALRPRMVDVLTRGLPAVKRQEFSQFFYWLSRGSDLASEKPGRVDTDDPEDEKTRDPVKIYHTPPFAPQKDVVDHVLSRLEGAELVMLSNGYVHLVPRGTVSVGDGYYVVRTCSEGYYLREESGEPGGWVENLIGKRARLGGQGQVWRPVAMTELDEREWLDIFGKRKLRLDLENFFRETKKIENLVVSLELS